MGQVTILVADDEAHITHVVALKLRNAGFEVLTACDGEEAFELATSRKPNLIITDLQMPYLNGLELCMRLRKTQATSTIPAIMLTARGHALAEADLERTNIRAVLSKPFSPRAILGEVQRMLAGDEADAPDKGKAAA